jgi:hypothetical protein
VAIIPLNEGGFWLLVRLPLLGSGCFFVPPIVTSALVSIPLRLLGVSNGVSEIVTPVIALPVAAYVTFLVRAAKVRNE